MSTNKAVEALINEGHNWFIPSLSVDCVIFGFHDNKLKILLVKHRHRDLWSLPGGFIFKEESADEAAQRVLRERTSLNEIFLQQFNVFGDVNRYDKNFHKEDLVSDGIKANDDLWILQRFLSIGYYALVEFSKVNLLTDALTEECMWWDVNTLPAMMLDHGKIIETALLTLRAQLNYQPIGYNLLSEKFTMPELQKLYETILNKNLDRRNFQRKIEGYKILKRLPERKKGVAHKAPFFYTFDAKKYQRALENGLSGGW